MKRSLLIWILGLFLPLTCAGQIWTVQTNVLDWAALGTANAEIGMSVSQHFSLVIGGRYNPWEFTDSKYNIPIRNQQQTAYLGVRFWPWYVNSGFWISAKAQYMFSFSNTRSRRERTALEAPWPPAIRSCSQSTSTLRQA